MLSENSNDDQHFQQTVSDEDVDSFDASNADFRRFNVDRYNGETDEEESDDFDDDEADDDVTDMADNRPRSPQREFRARLASGMSYNLNPGPADLPVGGPGATLSPKSLDKLQPTGGSSYVSRTSTGSRQGTISSRDESAVVESRPFLVGPPEFDLYGDLSSKSTAAGSSNGSYRQEAEDKVELGEDELPSENEEGARSEEEGESEVAPTKGQTWGFSRARPPPSEEYKPGVDESLPGKFQLKC